MNRFVASSGMSVFVVGGLFLLMVSLIQQKQMDIGDLLVLSPPVTIKMPPLIEKPHDKPEPPVKKKIVKQPPSENMVTPKNKPVTLTEMIVDPDGIFDKDKTFGEEFELGDSFEAVNSNAGENGLTPTIRIEPQYPIDARRKRQQGWVKLHYSVTTAGTVANVSVIDGEPRGVFDKVARKALYRWKFRPEVVNGKAVASTLQSVVLEFNLED